MATTQRRSRGGLLAAAGAVALVACLSLCPEEAFVGHAARGARAAPRGGALLTARPASAGPTGYTGFVPDMARRTLMNLVVTGSVLLNVVIIGAPLLTYFLPPTKGGGGAGIPALDAKGKAVTVSDWLKTHKEDDRELVQGFKGDPTYLITTKDSVKDFALNAVCTHLGCVVPWIKAENKFICPCHGSQYASDGKVVRGPAPLSLALAHIEVKEDAVTLKPWKETDFRTDLAPWWA